MEDEDDELDADGLALDRGLAGIVGDCPLDEGLEDIVSELSMDP